MTSKVFLGNAPVRAQVDTLTITGSLSGETLTISIGGTVIATHTDTTSSDIIEALNDLVSQWNTSTNVWATQITAARTTATAMTLTAITAGLEFTVTTAVDISSGVDFQTVVTTRNGGPNDYSDGRNWLNLSTNTTGTAPVAADDVFLTNCDVNIVAGLDQSAVALSSFVHDQTFTGRVGLDRQRFATSIDGTDTVDTIYEYRPDYLKINLAAAGKIDLGNNSGPGNPAGSLRLKISNVSTNITTTTVYSTATSSAEVGLPPTRLLFNSANAKLFILSARGGVGVAAEAGETSTIGTISVTDGGTGSIQIGKGVTFSAGSFRQIGGNTKLSSAGTLASLICEGGIITTDGDFTITAAEARGGKIISNHIKTSGNSITTLTLNGGVVDTTQSQKPRTIGTLVPNSGSLLADSSVLTITTFNQPTNKYSFSVQV